MNEQYYEKLLNIKTMGQQKGFNESFHYNRYEATSYHALNELFNNYKLDASDSIIDFGCGMGRLNFYVNHFFSSKVTGIEMNPYYYKISLNNKNTYLEIHKENPSKINFVNCLAENYKISSIDNIFYFFNPFSLQIFMRVVDNILISVENNLRPVDLILYYPSEEYIYFLENNTAFTLTHSIPITEKYKDNIREKFLIYRLDYSHYI